MKLAPLCGNFNTHQSTKGEPPSGRLQYLGLLGTDVTQGYRFTFIIAPARKTPREFGKHPVFRGLIFVLTAYLKAIQCL